MFFNSNTIALFICVIFLCQVFVDQSTYYILLFSVQKTTYIIFWIIMMILILISIRKRYLNNSNKSGVK